MAVIDTLTIVVDAKDLRKEIASALREIPFIEAKDGTKWADVSALFELADKWESGNP